MTYQKQTWTDNVTSCTQVTAERLNHIEEGIYQANNSLPVGTIISYSGSDLPENWLLCNGQEISRSDYSNLFNVIGTIYGEGNGSTTFNIPDLTGRTAIGVNGIYKLASKGGESTHKLTTAEMPSHNHGIFDSTENVDFLGRVTKAGSASGNYSGQWYFKNTKKYSR